MAADLLFYAIYVNLPYQPRFRVKILLNFAYANEASKANFHEKKRIIYWLPFTKLKVCYLLHSQAGYTLHVLGS